MKQAIRRFAGQSSKPQRASKSTSRQPDLENFQYDPITLKSPGEIVYLEYNPVELPPKPAEDWTRFVCISDTHSRSFPVPDGDVLLHSGDLTNTGTVSDFEVTMKWLYSLPHKVKIIIAGNHDLTLHTEWYESEWPRFHRHQGKQDLNPIMDLLTSQESAARGTVYLKDRSHSFKLKEDGRFWSVYGSPWSPYFGNWAFNYGGDVAEDLISKFPKTDILLTHGPPAGIFDRTIRGEDVGCTALRARLPELRPRIHLFGHIHEAHGACIHRWDSANDFDPPRVQVDDQNLDYQMRDDADAVDSATGVVDEERTVFVNAANWPMGRAAARRGIRVFGGPGFQAVVIDLKD